MYAPKQEKTSISSSYVWYMHDILHEVTSPRLSICVSSLWVTLFIIMYFFRLLVCCIHCLYLYTYLNLIQRDKLLREETEIIYLKVIALFLSFASFGSWVGTEQFFKQIISSLIAICTFFFQAFSDTEIAMFLSLASFGLCGNRVGSIFTGLQVTSTTFISSLRTLLGNLYLEIKSTSSKKSSGWLLSRKTRSLLNARCISRIVSILITLHTFLCTSPVDFDENLTQDVRKKYDMGLCKIRLS